MANEEIQQELAANIKFGVDPTSADNIAAGLDDVKTSVDQVGKQIAPIAANFNAAANAARGFLSAGRALKAIGGIIGDKDLAQLGGYISTIGRLEQAYTRLDKAIKQVNASNNTLGKVGFGAIAVAAGAALGAEAYDKFIGPNQQTMNYKTGVMEANTAGNILKQTGAVVSRELTLLAANLRGDKNAAEEANQSFKDTAVMYGLIKSDQENFNDELAQLKQQYGSMTIVFNGLAAAVDKTAKEGQVLGGILGPLGDKLAGLASSLFKTAAGQAAQQDPLVKAFDEAQKAKVSAQIKFDDQIQALTTQTDDNIAQAEKQKNDEILRAQQDLAQQQVDAEQQAGEERKKIILDFADQEVAAQDAYFKKRTAAVQTFGIEAQRLEEDFQRQQRYNLLDHNKKVRKLADDRDALGLEDENQSFKEQQAKDNESHNIEMKRRNEDAARTLALMAQQFADEEALRKKNEQKQLADITANEIKDEIRRKAEYDKLVAEKEKQFEDTKAKDEENFKTKSKDIQSQFDKELSQLDDNWTTRRQELGLWLGDERKQMWDYMAARSADLQQWVNTHLSMPGGATQQPAPPHIPGFAQGGYTGSGGQAVLHANEFVMSADTTRKLEGAVGGQLTQDKIAKMAGKPAFQPVVNVSVGPVTGDANEIGKAVQRHVYETIVQLAQYSGNA